MARLVGFILMLVAIYLGVTVYTEGADRAFGGLFASSENPGDAGEDVESAAPADPAVTRDARAGTAAPSAVTSRVRERVQGAVDDRSRRLGAE